MKKRRDILKVIVDAILFCAKNNLALRGTTEDIGQQNSGIFLSLIELISHYYLLVAEHIASVKAKKTITSYFSPRIQNELIELLGQKVRKEIWSNIKEVKYYSVLFDCTPDTSHKEQMTQIIRYVRISDETCTIKESFVDFIESHQKTGKGLATEISKKLEKDGLSISDCRGRGYDNGANMSGKYNGVKAHIHSLNESARFVPCAAHTLNLVGVHAAEVSPLMITFFGKVQAIFNFFSSFTPRWEKLMKTLTISLKRNSDTRWSTK
ncbi:zinc finger MYM-type protein 6-like [Hydra vulgaris]|uniref:Zinc finger MYM-type protein 6-like n=1 Tax=Hydra vulgaris TaxID=6087 RepID=A0ABM4B0W7_HYDVU